MSAKRTALVIGTGIGGLSSAIALERAGWRVKLFEKADALRASGSGLSVMSNAGVAMRGIGVDLQLDNYGAAITRFEIRHRKGYLLRELPLPDISREQDMPSVCISRTQLQQALLAQLYDAEFHFDKRAAGLSEGPLGVEVAFDDGSSSNGDILVGADGFYSSIREAIGISSPVREAGYICWLALVDRAFLDAGQVVHYWGKGKRFGIIDVGGGTTYWWGTANMPQQQAKNWRGGREDVAGYYRDWPDIVQEVIAATPPDAILAVDAKDRAFSETWGRGRVTLLGDAAHSMLTSLGQGAGMAIEDAAVLGHVMQKQLAPEQALRLYETLRRPRARAIVDASRHLSEVEQFDGFFARARRDIGMRMLPKRKLYQQIKHSLFFDKQVLHAGN
ncbi:FAD-dependent monooxygenase [Chromobacterium phragmitis]|uniref:Aromatic ring hydroxylase n=1 Tax=Chromobacterium phragmitis TaxID=2202141 RepID=A0A344UDE7_9NEIS|nr:FAD-dependent monooxygenase [Chromobacterium phragmitis]AXE33295.1 aromatic ring hydroxylase [Chromobacterium phragmitis]